MCFEIPMEIDLIKIIKPGDIYIYIYPKTIELKICLKI